ncbi:MULTISPECIES: GNAT family N-acetyltransferase [Exiguobacterium]|uniref:GNAT family N-acetyltransferase n=1 Tax=Exiguobacterium TaxID=33986 RepID=UPI001BECDB06|nr:MULTISPECIES: GNAT family N-acetyltransferase [Exiguobacterium]MCT4776468.1 GNAT family N-acetyltransferase [Exiguobacterium aquaticum]MCT4788288.1 GNAT family N-acetyltransferase [Exiguobacterium mexicanum]
MDKTAKILTFTTIDPAIDRATITAFRNDAHRCSYGETCPFEEASYLKWIERRVDRFPAGFVLVKEDGQPIGQLELQIVSIDDVEVGFINLIYLVPAYRGNEYGNLLTDYAETFFKSNGVESYQLRVSPFNARAIAFYEKSGFQKIKEVTQPHVLWCYMKTIGR